MRASVGRSPVTMESWRPSRRTAASSPEVAVNSVNPTRSVKTIAPVTDAISACSRARAHRDPTADRATRDAAVVAGRRLALALTTHRLHRDARSDALGQRDL